MVYDELFKEQLMEKHALICVATSCNIVLNIVILPDNKLLHNRSVPSHVSIMPHITETSLQPEHSTFGSTYHKMKLELGTIGSELIKSDLWSSQEPPGISQHYLHMCTHLVNSEQWQCTLYTCPHSDTAYL